MRCEATGAIQAPDRDSRQEGKQKGNARTACKPGILDTARAGRYLQKPRSDALFDLDPANSPTASCASSASRQVSFGRPQESPNSSKSRQEIGLQGPYYSAKAEARVARAFTGDTTGKPGGSRSGGFKSPFAEST